MPGRTLEAKLKGNSSLTVCANSCLGNEPVADDRAISHNKYVVLDSLRDGRENVVWQSSQNMAGGQDGELNNAITVAGNAKLASRYRMAFTNQVNHAGDNVLTMYDPTGDDPTAPVEAILFPRNEEADRDRYQNADIVAHHINKVDCAAGGRIRIASAALDQRLTRPAIYEALETKRKARCTVDVVARDFHESGDNNGINDLTNLDVVAYSMRPGGCRYKNGASCNRGTVHSKYLLTEWTDAQGKQIRNVYTGSYNWTMGALRNNDEGTAPRRRRGDLPGVRRQLRQAAHRRRRHRRREVRQLAPALLPGERLRGRGPARRRDGLERHRERHLPGRRVRER
ncbi:hypothetical protein [Streptomyces sp. NPDC051567]|uniref:hypothetical protein n=1 Tax=Streptomyces sp. NPDC051567 TaxID=3365660 RepID=UPI0037A7F526